MTTYQPEPIISLEDCIAASKAVAARADIPYSQVEDVFRIEVADLAWDIGVQVYTPLDESQIAVGADGKKIGAFFLHGGQDDWRQMEPWAKVMAAKFGWKVVVGTFPGRLYLQDPSRNWPGDTISPDGTVRTPIWLKDELITDDQYDLVHDTSMKARYGTRTVIHAKPGTLFYYRMAAWPLAMEKGMVTAMARHFPIDQYSVYFQGHSTGGPNVFMLCQRVPNCEGVLAAENSPFGYITMAKHAWSGQMGVIEGYERVSKSKEDAKRRDPFYELYIRSWRDLARYAGPEALGKEGPSALMRLPSLMEEVFEDWSKQLPRPLFKCEYLITHRIEDSLIAAARVTAGRLRLDEKATEALVEHYIGLTEELRGPDVKPVPNVLFGISKNSRDHNRAVYLEVILPLFAAMDPAPRTALQHFRAGVHQLWGSEPEMPQGILPAVAVQWDAAIKGGFFLRAS